MDTARDEAHAHMSADHLTPRTRMKIEKDTGLLARVSRLEEQCQELVSMPSRQKGLEDVSFKRRRPSIGTTGDEFSDVESADSAAVAHSCTHWIHEHTLLFFSSWWDHAVALLLMFIFNFVSLAGVFLDFSNLVVMISSEDSEQLAFGFAMCANNVCGLTVHTLCIIMWHSLCYNCRSR